MCNLSAVWVDRSQENAITWFCSAVSIIIAPKGPAWHQSGSDNLNVLVALQVLVVPRLRAFIRICESCEAHDERAFKATKTSNIFSL